MEKKTVPGKHFRDYGYEYSLLEITKKNRLFPSVALYSFWSLPKGEGSGQ